MKHLLADVAAAHAKKSSGIKVVSRCVEGGIRVWRIE